MHISRERIRPRRGISARTEASRLRGRFGLRFFALLLIPFLLLANAMLPVFSAKEEASSSAAQFFSVAQAGTASLSLSAQSAVLCNAETGEVYYEANAAERRSPASTTKIMTAIVAIEAAPLDTVVKVAPEAVGTEGSSVYLYAGETLTLETLLYALLLESANDAAVAIAYGIDGSVETFAERMNAKAESLGLTNTHFTNPHGLDDEAHYTTARDLASIAAYALKNEIFRKIVSTYKRTVPQENTDGVRLFVNHNRLLRTYDGCIGVKTGYTKRSGRCLVSAAERDGVSLVAVTLSAPNDWKDHEALLDYGFAQYTSVTVAPPEALSVTLPVLNGITDSAVASYEAADGIRMSLPRTHGEITAVYQLPRFLWGNYESGETVGYVTFYEGGRPLCTLPLTLNSPVRQISYRLFQRRSKQSPA